MFGTGKSFFGGLVGLFFFSIIVFFVIYFLVPDVSIKFFGISVNSDEYVDGAVSQSIESLDLPDGVLSELQDYLSSPEGRQYLESAQTAAGNGTDKILEFTKSVDWQNLLNEACAAVASGASSFSDFFASHPISSSEGK